MVAPTRVNARELQPDGAGRRALADQDVEAAVLHGRVEHLLDRPVEAVDLVDEEHVAVLQVGEERGEVAGPGQHRAGGDAESRRPSRSPRSRPARSCPGRAARRRGCGRPAWRRWRAACRTIPRCSTSCGLPDELRQRPRPESDLLELFVTVRRRRVDDARPRGRARRARPPSSTASTSRGGLTGSPARPARAAPGAASLPPRHRRVGRRAHRGSRRGHNRARPGRPGPRPATSGCSGRRLPPGARHRRPPPDNERSGRSSRLFSSISSRAAVLRPTRAPCTGCRGRPRARPWTGRPARAWP